MVAPPTVCLVLELLRVHLVEVLEDGGLDDLAVDCGDSVDGVAGDNGQIGHAHKPGRGKTETFR